MRIKLEKIIAVMAALVCFFMLQVPTAKADDITYTYTGAGDFAGTDFTYLSTGAYLSYGSEFETPTTASDLIFEGDDFGRITSVGFPSGTQIYVVASDEYGDADYGSIYNIGVAGTYDLSSSGGGEGPFSGTLEITDTSVATPEPGTLGLMLIGIGLVLMMRKRLGNL